MNRSCPSKRVKPVNGLMNQLLKKQVEEDRSFLLERFGIIILNFNQSFLTVILFYNSGKLFGPDLQYIMLEYRSNYSLKLSEN